MVEYFKANPLLLGALITAVAGVLLAILNSLFSRWNSTHSTNLEIQKKEYERRAVNWEKRIKDAREYVDLYDSLIDTHRKFVESIFNAETLEEFLSWKEYYGIGKKLDEFLLNTRSRRTNIKVLNDKQLDSLMHSLRQQISRNSGFVANASEQMDKVADNETFHEIKRQQDWDKFEYAFHESDTTLIAIKNRLDKLAQKVP